MNKVNFAIALHFHQPIGNFEHIFERAYGFCYSPFFELLSNYPEIKAMVHISGCLLDYLDKKHPEAIKLIKRMISRRQIEIMGGGYYEPIITALPDNDLSGQIGMMSDYIKQRFGSFARGMWVAERVWDPKYSGRLYSAGIRYIILDDEHLVRSGVKRENIQGYFLTGSGIDKIAVFPSSKQLRYLIPFKPIEELLSFFKNVSRQKNILLTYGDDGEKFGEWPGTYAHVYDNKWLANFFDMLKENKHWIKTVHLSDFLKKNKPAAKLKIRQGSYEEMMEWSGGNWMNYLSKYPESNQMHKKMHYVSSKIEKLRQKAGKEDRKKIEGAVRELYKGECNCGYWHGVFGGLYLYHLRQGIYNHMIEAEKIIDSIVHKSDKSWLDIKKLDYDFDKKEEIIIENNDFSLYIDPDEGGVIKELDCRAVPVNLVNTLSRKKEPYHEKILNAAGMAPNADVATIHDDIRAINPAYKAMLIYDKTARYFFRSYFFEGELALDDFVAASYKEAGDFSTGAYEAKIDGKSVILKRESKASKRDIALTKKIQIAAGNKIKFSSLIANKGAAKLGTLFGLEFNITMPSLNAEKYCYVADGEDQGDLNTEGQTFEAESFGILDGSGELGIDFRFSKRPSAVLYFPVKTISQSERAYELNYQCSCMLFLWNAVLKKDSLCSIDIDFILDGA